MAAQPYRTSQAWVWFSIPRFCFVLYAGDNRSALLFWRSVQTWNKNARVSPSFLKKKILMISLVQHWMARASAEGLRDCARVVDEDASLLWLLQRKMITFCIDNWCTFYKEQNMSIKRAFIRLSQCSIVSPHWIVKLRSSTRCIVNVCS